MRKHTRTLTLALSMVVALLLLQASGPGASASDDGDGQRRAMTLHVVFSPPSYTDLGADGFSAADLIVFHDELFQERTKVGDEVGSCVMVDNTGLSNCTGVVRLDDRGTITFSFVNAPPPHKVLAITGGSGRFRGAHGDGTLDENGDGTGTLVLRLSA